MYTSFCKRKSLRFGGLKKVLGEEKVKATFYINKRLLEEFKKLVLQKHGSLSGCLSFGVERRNYCKGVSLRMSGVNSHYS